jgi:hypothetical protein
MAAERRNEMALYGPTEAMLADYEVEREREAHDPFLAWLSDPAAMERDWDEHHRWVAGNDWQWGEVA